MAPPGPCSGASLGDLYAKCVQLVNENKISTKNAFDLHLIEHMDDIVDSFMGGGGRKRVSAASPGGRFSGEPAPGKEKGVAENRFHEASCTIEASARIYACRVDCVHTDTYRVLGGLNSTDFGDDDEDGTAGGTLKRRRIIGVNTLERNEKNIVQQHIEADEQSDPTFRRMAAAFDAGGAKGLLLSHLPIAEDLSLVFNGDFPLTRAVGAAVPMFCCSRQLRANELGFGDPEVANAKIVDSRLCAEVDKFRQLLHGDAQTGVYLPERLDTALALAGCAEAHSAAANGPLGAMPAIGGAAALDPLLDEEQSHPVTGAMDDAFGADDDDWAPDSVPCADRELAAPGVDAKADRPQVPPSLTDGEPLQLVGAELGLKSDEDVVAFDELFEKFCGTGGLHQFAYFDACWAKTGRDKDATAADPIADEGAEAQEAPEPRDKGLKRPLFDLSGLDQPARPIETEPCHKHQLSERAAHWQLHKDVPPYMIDRITMPSWPTWSRCDFACLGLRPHLMLKLVRKGPPEAESDGPHCFADLFSTVVVENPEAFPWLASEARRAAACPGARFDRGAGLDGDDAAVEAERDMEFGDDDGDFDGHGLPAHLDVDPQDLFLRPGDTVLPGGDQDADDFAAGGDMPFAPGLDFDLVDQPTTVGCVDISYSRNSKFVDVKLVKKHLWDCISHDIEQARAAKMKQTSSSFQELVHRITKKMPKGETENLSVAVCFICALHLCNEKGLELETDPNRPLEDFAVVGRA